MIGRVLVLLASDGMRQVPTIGLCASSVTLEGALVFSVDASVGGGRTAGGERRSRKTGPGDFENVFYGFSFRAIE